MRKVFNSAIDVMHVYAQRSQEEGRSSNVFFYGDKIYSYGYHYLLGEFIDEGKAIIINDTGYSVTTSKHISQLKQATRQYKQFFVSTINNDRVVKSMQELFNKLPTARNKAKYINEINSIFEKYVEYLDYLKVTKSKLPSYKEAKRIHKAVNSMDVDAILKKEAERKKKLLDKKIADFRSFKINYISGTNLDYLRINGDYVETSQHVKVSKAAAKELYNCIKSGVDIIGRRIEGYTVISTNGKLKIGCHNISMTDVKLIGEML